TQVGKTYTYHCIHHSFMTGVIQTVPQVTQTPNPNGTNLSLTVGLHGIGKGGDNANPTGQGNNSPKHPARSVTGTLFDLQNTQAGQGTGTITFDAASGLFKGTISLGSLTTGDYQVKLQTPGFLIKRLTAIIHIVSGQTTTVE